MENISIATQTEYTLHYGTTPSPEPDYLAYLTDQKIIEEGTLGYIFDGDDPEGEHIVLPNAYTSYAKILNTLSDGTTKETTEYRQVKNYAARRASGIYLRHPARYRRFRTYLGNAGKRG